MREEIRSITDVENLELLSETSSIRDVSDTASRRLLVLDRELIQPSTVLMISTGQEQHFVPHTAPSQLERSLETYHSIQVDELDDIVQRISERISDQDLMPSNQRVIAMAKGFSNRIQPAFDSRTALNHGQLLAAIKEKDQAVVKTASPILKAKVKAMEAMKATEITGRFRLKRILAEVKVDLWICTLGKHHTYVHRHDKAIR
jgi:uncharacterized protein